MLNASKMERCGTEFIQFIDWKEPNEDASYIPSSCTSIYIVTLLRKIRRRYLLLHYTRNPSTVLRLLLGIKGARSRRPIVRLACRSSHRLASWWRPDKSGGCSKVAQEYRYFYSADIEYRETRCLCIPGIFFYPAFQKHSTFVVSILCALLDIVSKIVEYYENRHYPSLLSLAPIKDIGCPKCPHFPRLASKVSHIRKYDTFGPTSIPFRCGYLDYIR